MKITRIGRDKDLSIRADVIEVELTNGKLFSLEERFGKIYFSDRDGNSLIVSPCCANIITVSSED